MQTILMTNRKIALIPITFFLSGCIGMSGYNFKTISGKYNIGWIDEKSNQRICRAIKSGEHGGETLIKPYVFSIGHNDQFIIAKKHPGENGVIDTKTLNYFIINMTMKPYAGQEEIYGPLSRSQFDRLRRKMKIENIAFEEAD